MTNRIDHTHVRVKDGFWQKKQQLVRAVTAPAVRQRFCETGRFAALRCAWGASADAPLPHIFWDSDVAKWMEGAAYLLGQQPDEELAAAVRQAVDDIVRHADQNGYFNSHFLVTEQDRRFQDRNAHELYCAGHLIEAAVALQRETGDDTLLRTMCRYADYIDRVFRQEKSAGFSTPGHPELELALVRLYEATGEERYLRLATYFIDEHGRHPDEPLADAFTLSYNQDEMPLRQRATAEGHCVRALYLYCAMADLAAHTGDAALLAACGRVFDNMTGKRMYLTGGLGSTCVGEAFTVDYHLPNRTAYAETCAAIGMALFCGRMQALTADARYGDILEKELYNGILSGLSLSGDAFFYENPLAVDPLFNSPNTSTTEKARYPLTRRQKLFACSCCPPNLVRFIPSIGDWVYSYDERTLYVHQYLHADMRCGDMAVLQTTDYPADGVVRICCQSGGRRLALRIPGWCRRFTLSVPYEMQGGYAVVAADVHELELRLEMPVTLVRAERRVHADAGRLAVMRGPVVYCAEGVDNGGSLDGLLLLPTAEWRQSDGGDFLLPVLHTEALREAAGGALYTPLAEVKTSRVPLTMIPYYAFANRGESEMRVFLPAAFGA